MWGWSVVGTASDQLSVTNLSAGQRLQIRRRRPTGAISLSRSLRFETLEDRRMMAVTGDYNRNDAVDAADYVLWRKTRLQVVVANSGADGNGDAFVDQSDYNIWRSGAGNTLAGTVGQWSPLINWPLVAI